MPRQGATIYDLLISCPGDVKKYVDTIKECIEGFNHTIGNANNIMIMPRHWSTDSYPQSGDTPQEILNKQFVRDCDVAVAIFWTRFGTATEKYDSGTEEEIEEMLSSGKQVFLYFCNEAIVPSQIDMQQYEKVTAFKEKYKDKGLYSIFNNENELRQSFTNHLSMYFLKTIDENGKKHNIVNNSPVLFIRGASGEDAGHANVKRYNACNSEFMKEKEKKILEKIDSLQKNNCPPRTEMNAFNADNQYSATELSKILAENSSLYGSLVEFDNKLKKTISSYAEKHSISLNSDFWNIGDLRKQQDLIPSYLGGQGIVLTGGKDEKERYKEIVGLYRGICEYNEYCEFFSLLDRIPFVTLILSNEGTTYDEDLDIKIYIRKGCYVPVDEIPVPGSRIIKEIIEDGFYDFAYKIPRTANIDAYTGYTQEFGNYPAQPFPFIDNTSAIEKYNQNKAEYKENLEHIFCYEQFSDEENDILVFHVDYIKHNTKMAFPSVLFFFENPEILKYEITSKHISSIITGEIILDSSPMKNK